ncbi:amino acid/amide ABC transporter substrate-binding protein, HAAT family [Acidothermus cellulolyticus 11B]|uniref:Amino acid/amide ABC transporter substrate-binding protein, HAAT family n=1 Tax=Acidothermus cellulolyticus (strain ATCC 43068 / DSM 8971 / 11B) TaxID=351607 RepID=A0LTU4_ACIC1|nr:branched-chain amino acid ABC transporter substrate-binding protein [Acidothermus cellulolyticus]ABK52854.1 amino acid/amide ABC transporter substrate-binding protein, HAAT family [Acidothermus cellulolyticus 11B]
MKRRFAAAVIPLTVAGLVVSACSSGKSSGGSGGKPVFKIGYEGPLSGGNAQLGLNMKYAVQLAINEANAKGDLPFVLQYTEADDQGSGDKSPAAAQQLIDDKQVMAVVGPAFSGATKAAEPKFADADLATVSPSATSPALATFGWKTFFRIVADDNAQGPADADYAVNKLGIKNIFAIDDASAYGQPLEQAFENQAKKDGAQVTHQSVPGTTQCQAGSGNTQQYPAVATTIKNSGAELVFYAGYYCDFALLAKALRQAGYTGKLFSDDASLDPKYIEQAGASVAEGTYISCACADITTNPKAQSFVTNFKKLAGFDVSVYSAEAYDATNVIISVLKELGPKATRAQVVDKLRTVDYQGITKEVKFQSNGNIAGSAVYIYQVQNGKIVSLGLSS